MSTLQLVGSFLIYFFQISQTVSGTSDEECFFSNYIQGNSTPGSEDTFEVRVNPHLLIEDVITLTKDEVVNVTISGEEFVFPFCMFFMDLPLCNGTLVPDWELPDEARDIFLVFDGSSICGGMEEKEVRVNSTEKIPTPVNKNCHYQCIDAVLGPDAPMMEFPYYHWVLDVDVDSLIPPPTEYTNKLTVKAGSSINIAVTSIVLGFAFFLQLF